MSNNIGNIFKAKRDFARDRIICKPMRDNLKCHEFTLITNDCMAGIVYHDLHVQFMSPVINMFISASEYVKFLGNLQYYINLPFKEIHDNNFPYPLAKIGDVTLHLIHYKTIQEAEKKWRDRSSRIRYEKRIYVMNDRNNCSEEDYHKFAELPLPMDKKIFITVHRDWNDSNCRTIYYGSKGIECPIMTSYTKVFSIKRRLDVVNWVEAINSFLEE